MFERVGRAAERAAAGVSRRDCLGRLGRAAAAAAAAAGGMVALPATTGAGGPVRICGPNSFGTCAGFPVGSGCSSGGVCKRMPGSADCYCDTKDPRRFCS